MADREILTEALARVEGEGAHARARCATARSRTCGCASTSRRASSRRSCAAGASPRCPDITARICGICPVAYQMSSIAAMEDACGVEPCPTPIRALRRLLYCGEWIESHALHVFMLHAPDFLGYASAFDDGARPPRRSSSARCALKKAGNALMRVVGGREIHPVNVRVGGFYRAPTRARARTRRGRSSRRAREFAARGRRLGRAALPLPGLRGGLRLRRAARSRASTRSRAAGWSSSTGLDLAPREFDEHVVEEHVAALHRAALAPARRDALPRRPAGALRAQPRPALAGGARGGRRGRAWSPSCRNPFRSIVVRCGGDPLRASTRPCA